MVDRFCTNADFINEYTYFLKPTASKFLLALVVPLFLRFHLSLGCYIPPVIQRSYVLVFAFLFVGFAITLRWYTTVCISEFRVLVSGFHRFFTFPFLFDLVVPLLLRFHLDVGCYIPFGVKKLRFWCLPYFLPVLPSRFVATQRFVSEHNVYSLESRYPPSFLVFSSAFHPSLCVAGTHLKWLACWYIASS